MDYKKLIVMLLSCIDDENKLRFIYKIVKAIAK